MNILRSTLAVIVGYAIFVVSAFALFHLFGIAPHADPAILTLVIVIAWGAVFSWLGGFVAQWIAGAGRLTVNYILAGIMAGFAAFSLLKSEGNHYTQIAAIFLFAPMSFLGGVLKLRLNKKA
jgi:hypothetical protein